MDFLTIVGKIFGLITAAIGCIFLIRKLWLSLRPVQITQTIIVSFEDSTHDQLQTTITNISTETIYLSKCHARAANSMAYIIKTFLCHPFIKPRLYNNVLFGLQVFEMMGDADPISLAPGQPVTLARPMTFDMDFCFFSTPMVQIEAILSDGRVFRSSRQEIPNRWHWTWNYKQKGIYKHDSQ